MKKIALIAFLLAVSVAAGRAQESRQDISLSGTGLVEPFMASSTTVQVSSNRAFGALLSYRFMLTPTSALEANYQMTYENNIHFYANPNNYNVNMGASARFTRPSERPVGEVNFNIITPEQFTPKYADLFALRDGVS